MGHHDSQAPAGVDGAVCGGQGTVHGGAPCFCEPAGTQHASAFNAAWCMHSCLSNGFSWIRGKELLRFAGIVAQGGGRVSQGLARSNRESDTRALV